MFASGKIRSQMHFGVAMLVVIVLILSAASFQGSLKFRTLTKSIRGRATELPLSAKLSQTVSDLRSASWKHRFNKPTFGDYQPTIKENPIAPISALSKLEAARTALRNYKLQLENLDTSKSLLGDNEAELKFVLDFEESLNRIEQIIQDKWAGIDPFDHYTTRLTSELDKLQDDTNKLPGLMNDRMNLFANKARREYNSWMALTALVTLGAMALIYLLYHRFNKRIFKPLDSLVDGSRIVAKGNYDFRIKLESDDEVAELGAAMNAMTANFQEIKLGLNEKVKQRTKEVVRSEKMASVGFLAAGVAHEINNPLAAIAWSAESLESRLYDILNPSGEVTQEERDAEIEDMKKYLTRIQDEAFRCNGITSRLLDFSRMGDPTKGPTNLYEVIESVLGIVRPLSKYRGRNIEFDGDPSVLALANEQEIKQVALNLITNALDCVPEGGEIRIRLFHENKKATLVVSDNGCGMTDEVMQHLFEPFFTRRRDGQGTGLGLSITYQIIEDHGGKITPFSHGPGRGSSFTVSLPLAKNEQYEIARAA